MNHEKIRDEMDVYISHAKTKGLKFQDYAGINEYSNLLNQVVGIEYAMEKEFNKKLLKTILHELISYNGFKAFDVPPLEEVEEAVSVRKKDIVELDFSYLIRKIEKVIEDD